MRSIPACIAAIVLSATSAGACTVDNWRYFQTSTSFVEIQGTTTCAAGVISIRAFDGSGGYLGNSETLIRGYAFNALIEAIAPKTMNLKYSITPR